MLTIYSYQVSISPDINKKLTQDRKEKLKKYFFDFNQKFGKTVAVFKNDKLNVHISPGSIRINFEQLSSIQSILQHAMEIMDYQGDMFYISCEINAGLTNGGLPIKDFEKQCDIMEKIAKVNLKIAQLPTRVDFMANRGQELTQVGIEMTYEGMKVTLSDITTDINEVDMLIRKLRDFAETDLVADLKGIFTGVD